LIIPIVELLEISGRWDLIKNMNVTVKSSSYAHQTVVRADSKGVYAYRKNTRSNQADGEWVNLRPPVFDDHTPIQKYEWCNWEVSTVRDCDVIERLGPYVIAIRNGYIYCLRMHGDMSFGSHNIVIGYDVFPSDAVWGSMRCGVCVHPCVVSNGTTSLRLSYGSRGRLLKGALYRVQDNRPRAIHMHEIFPNPEIQEAITLAAMQADEDRVGEGAWEDGDILVKRHRRLWHVGSEKVELYWELKDMWKRGEIYKSTLHACERNRSSIDITDTRGGEDTHVGAVVSTKRPIGFYDIWVNEDGYDEYKIRIPDGSMYK